MGGRLAEQVAGFTGTDGRFARNGWPVTVSSDKTSLATLDIFQAKSFRKERLVGCEYVVPATTRWRRRKALPNRRKSMRKIKEVLRLKYSHDLSERR